MALAFSSGAFLAFDLLPQTNSPNDILDGSRRHHRLLPSKRICSRVEGFYNPEATHAGWIIFYR